MTASDIEAQVALAGEFQPSLEGPLVGQKKSSHAITEEYAKADPVYVAKTAVLPQTYSHYRPILGDGNCGWRAVGFAYFETFLRLQSRARIEEEIVRMSSLSNLLVTAGGFEQWLFDDMVLQTTDLLKTLAEHVETNPQKAESILLERFNDREVSDAIVYHFRLLASSWLKANPTLYEGFILDGNGVDAYSKNYIEPVNLEIEHLIMCLLIDVLLKPIGIAVEIVYLDRTPGTQANMHVICAEDPSGVSINPGSPVIHLLFRPSHYDILYKDQPALVPLLASPPQGTNVQANRAFTQQFVMQSTPAGRMGSDLSFDASLLTQIPGFSLPTADSSHRQSPRFPIMPDHSYAPSVGSAPPVSPGASSTHSVSSGVISSYAMPGSDLGSPSLHSPTSMYPQAQLSMHSDPSGHGAPIFPFTELPSRSTTSSFRPSKYEWAAACDRQQDGHVAFQTPTFKNSHYNTAHYNNVNFQPEQWEPESEEAIAARKRSSR